MFQDLKNCILKKNTIHIFYYNQTEKLSDEIFQQFLLQLPDSFQQDINAYKHWQSAQASLLGKILLQKAFQQLALNYTLHDIKIGAKDRPFINEEIDFNISHSGDYVIAAISDFSKVGIDIEKHRILKMNVADRYFDKMECMNIDLSENPQKAFFDFWSLKESAIKCDGRGVEILSDTHVLLSDNIPLSNNGTVLCATEEFIYSIIEIEAAYSCCVCCNADFEYKIHSIQFSQLL